VKHELERFQGGREGGSEEEEDQALGEAGISEGVLWVVKHELVWLKGGREGEKEGARTYLDMTRSFSVAGGEEHGRLAEGVRGPAWKRKTKMLVDKLICMS